MTQHHFYADHLVDALLEEGIPAESIWELDGWKDNEPGYYWTDVFTEQHHGYDGVANGHKFHHTASTGYTPYVKSNGKTKATMWAGMRRGDRLYQDGGGVPTLAIASAGPADYSSGSGVRDYVKGLANGIAQGRQTSSDDNPKWYGNRYCLNTEVVCDGIGGAVDEALWDLLPLYGAALSRLHDANEYFNGFHQGFTKRKIDYRDGRYPDATRTLEALWIPIGARLGNDPPPVEKPPVIDPPPIDPEPNPPEEELVDIGRNQQYVREGQTGQDVEYWQNIIIQVVEDVLDEGNSTKTFFEANAPASLTWKVWDAAMTTYLSGWTRRNSYGIGATERKMLDQAYTRLVVGLD